MFISDVVFSYIGRVFEFSYIFDICYMWNCTFVIIQVIFGVFLRCHIYFESVVSFAFFVVGVLSVYHTAYTAKKK